MHYLLFCSNSVELSNYAYHKCQGLQHSHSVSPQICHHLHIWVEVVDLLQFSLQTRRWELLDQKLSLPGFPIEQGTYINWVHSFTVCSLFWTEDNAYSWHILLQWRLFDGANGIHIISTLWAVILCTKHKYNHNNENYLHLIVKGTWDYLISLICCGVNISCTVGRQFPPRKISHRQIRVGLLPPSEIIPTAT